MIHGKKMKFLFSMALCCLLAACGGKTVDNKLFAVAWAPQDAPQSEISPEQAATEISRCLGQKDVGTAITDPAFDKERAFVVKQLQDGDMRYAQIYYYYGDTFMLITERFAIALNFTTDSKGKIRECLVEKISELVHK